MVYVFSRLFAFGITRSFDGLSVFFGFFGGEATRLCICCFLLGCHRFSLLPIHVAFAHSGQDDSDGRTFPFDAFDREHAFVLFYDMLADRKSQSAAAGRFVPALFSTVEALKDASLLILRDADACIRYRKDHLVCPLR